MLIIKDEKGIVRQKVITHEDEVRWQWVSPTTGLMLPRHPDFNGVLQTTFEPGYQAGIKSGKSSQFLVVDSSNGTLRQASKSQAIEYALGGEMELVTSQQKDSI